MGDLRVMVDKEGAARHILDVVWLIRSPMSVGRRGIFYLSKLFIYTCLLPIYIPAYTAPGGGGGGLASLDGERVERAE